MTATVTGCTLKTPPQDYSIDREAIALYASKKDHSDVFIGLIFEPHTRILTLHRLVLSVL